MGKGKAGRGERCDQLTTAHQLGQELLLVLSQTAEQRLLDPLLRKDVHGNQDP